MRLVLDGNEAAALVAHKTSEVIAIYPITPASAMGELADEWSAKGRPNLWGDVPAVIEMQSEGGAAGAVHGSLQAGSLTTTFTSSQGLLLMLPDMFKIAGELTPFVMHVAARAIATSALSIFGDHSDVMAARGTGFAMLCASDVQEAHDFAAVATAATLRARVPFLHFFDGFRTSHEINVIDGLSDDDLRTLIDETQVRAHRERALSPDHPVIRGSAQNPDVFFQSREASTPFYAAVPNIVEETFDRLAELSGRRYHAFEYVGDPEAEHVVVMMGSGIGAAEEALRPGQGLVKVRLYRPFDGAALAATLPATTKAIAVLDRSKDPAALGEPLYEDVITALAEQGRLPKRLLGGRYGLGSKEFTPAMAAAVFAELAADDARLHFTVGIDDDVSHSSLTVDDTSCSEPDDVVRCVFYGLGSDGTVGANKNSAKIIGTQTPLYSQGYFVIDSKKSGSTTVSHLRFGPRPIRSSYLVEEAQFVACHQFDLLPRIDVLEVAGEGATVLLNAPYGPDDVWDRLPRAMQEQIGAKHLRLYVVDASKVAREAGLPGRVNTILQACFFALSGVLPAQRAIGAIKEAISTTYAKRGEEIVARNFRAVDMALDALHEVDVDRPVSAAANGHADTADGTPDLIRALIAGRGNALPVSALPVDGTFPLGTARFEKRNLADELPVWDESICIDCAKCALVCPHAAIRMKVFDPSALAGAPAGFKSKEWRAKDLPGMQMTIQVSPDDCTGCRICIETCPAKDKHRPDHKSLDSLPKAEHVDAERERWEFFLTLPEMDRAKVQPATVKGSQMLQPLFEFSGACSGCGETPYLKLLTQLFGDRMLVANATGCSSIYGGNLPTTPWTTNADGRGPAWANSLFEDNAEFGFGMRLALDHQSAQARRLLGEIDVESDLRDAILSADQSDEAGVIAQRERVVALKVALAESDDPRAERLAALSDALVKTSVWIVGGDGWAYDIGFGGLDHVLASGRNVNVLVLDTEVYSNTGGQASKSTPRGAVAKFAAGGKHTAKKDLGLIAAGYGNVYVAQIALGADNPQTVKAFAEAESYDGPSLIIAYSHCIAHGIEMATAMAHQKEAADSGYWPLYRYDPRIERPFQLDSRPPKIPVSEFTHKENRFNLLARANPAEAEELAAEEQHDVDERWRLYERLANPS
ncbi:MAG TPA: pyruvate:ferredoxin (flavodoxin) oxidoreductase [Gaiellaceae bacterium]